ncbi:GNAT family N-acetyltransferase [Verrucomicrobiales bacterium BCK34]|nr:GNAT family N-acetyltransferase [Verrucomicrobiales bacterium BCK34]
MAPGFTFTPLQGGEILPHIESLGRLRIAVFREFPYLYDGTLASEEDYLGRYADQPESLVVLMHHQGELVGATTGMPLKVEMEPFQKPFRENGFLPDEIFYFGESIILPPFRGRGAGKRFFELREGHAMKSGSYRLTTFCAVDRGEAHPSKPAHYRPLDSFWKRMGYHRHDRLKCELPWKEVGGDEEQPHRLTFWIKDHSSSSDEVAS